MMNCTSHIDLLKSKVPEQMDEWAKNKIAKMGVMQAKKLAYSQRESPLGLVCSATHLLFRNFYLKLYQESNLQFKKEIIVLTQVLNDGLGDYYAASEAARVIKASFPQQKICLIPVFCSAEQSQKVSLPKKMDYHICQAGEACPPKIIERIKNASFVLEIPWKVDVFTSRDISAIRDTMKFERKYFYIAEYGSLNHGMGLEYQDEGIFIKKVPSKSSMNVLKTKALKRDLFGKEVISEDVIKEYFQQHELFFSYLPEEKKIMRMFLYTIASSLRSQNKIIDIISHLSPLDEEIDFQFLKEQGIAAIEFINKDSSLNVKKEIAEEGKLVRVFNPFPLPQKDLHILMINSHLLTGCTGDQSFSEAISFNKLPFYEFKTHKQLFFWHFLRLAEMELDSEENSLVEYLTALMQNIEINNLSEEEIKKNSMVIGKMINDPTLFEAVQKLDRIIQEKFSFNETLKAIVAQKIFHEKFPKFARLEQEIIGQVCSEKISSFQEIWDRMSGKAQEYYEIL